MNERTGPITLPWKCENCKARLGLLDTAGEILTIKVKDTYIWIHGGDVSMTCRACGSINTLEQYPQIEESQRMDKNIDASFDTDKN